MAMTYKQLADKARLILSRMEKSGIQNDTVTTFKNNLEVFWQRAGKKSPTKSGISINKKMTTEQRKEMATILRSFINAPRNTPQKIESDWKKQIGEYLKPLSPKYQEQYEQKIQNMSISEKSRELERLDRIGKTRKINQSLGSRILQYIYRRQQNMQLSSQVMQEAIIKAIDAFEQEHIDVYNMIHEMDIPEKDKESMWQTYKDDEMFNNKEAFWDSIIDFYDQIVNESGEF